LKYEIPTSFQLAGHRWKVRRVKTSGLYGDCDTNTHTIRVSIELDGKPTTAEQQYATFLHEFIHAALHTLGIEDNEQLAAGLEQMLLQMTKTARWKR
jgi:hypothetical protein